MQRRCHSLAHTVTPLRPTGMYVFSVIPPVFAWLSVNMSPLPLSGEGPDADTKPPLVLGARLGTWDIPLVNAFVIHAAAHISA